MTINPSSFCRNPDCKIANNFLIRIEYVRDEDIWSELKEKFMRDEVSGQTLLDKGVPEKEIIRWVIAKG